ncbi:SEC14 domain and spectrin repeat-containing protein 1-B isoform X1 [Drosophila takahashii]|uniref:SEC14 domain and spectrin repeat-containing protein 1-B isoform X1 n=1 Tax=Drosophila takahashii TaxID=29030 RepID=UPI001CF8A5E6|nr:SEC14 domain and spectrin repeat-containing protein 1-B isoform X1 [Drosophila takahashii]XP_044250420.1 SEC14 domain and spectrin repeat-containing protein 1-B isoform X1 [Drosophila takahashii]XP_044250421.1 SEC14 domain and spectrin repeat-containing protein 1-B isoform X1 [Drosophila takahashii]
MEEDVLNALQTRSVYLSGGFDRQKRIIFVVNAFNDLQLWNRRYLQVTLDYLKRSLSASVLQNGVSVVVNAQESSSRISRQQVRQIYALFGGDINVDLYLVRAEGFWEKHVEPCTKSQVKGEPLVLSKARLFKFIEPQNLPEELGGTLQFNYDLWLQQRKSIDEFTKSHVQTLGSMERLLALLREHKSLRPAEADVELKKCAQLHAGVQNDIETAIDMGNAILARFNEVYETHSPPPQAVAPASESPVNAHPPPMPAHSATGIPPQQQLKPLLPPDLVCERARIELRLNEIEKKQTAIRTAWLELLRSLREARELGTLEEGVSFVTNWILQQAEQLLSRQRSIAGDVRGCEALRSAHDQLELECRETYGCYAELLYKIERFAGERQASPKDKDLCQDLLSQRDFMQFVCRSFAKRLERRRNVLMTALRFHRLLEQFEELLTTGNHVVEVDSRSLDWPEAEQLLMQLKENQEMLGHVERELVREGEKLSDMLAMPVKDALGRDLQLDYSPEIAQLRRQIDESRRRRQVCWSRLALQRLTLEQVTHIHAYEEDARRARDWLQELYAVLLRCHSHVGCNIHEIQLQKDELQGFEETGRSIYHYGCQLLEASQTLRLCCKLDPAASRSQSNLGQSLISDELQLTWHSLQAVAQEQMTRLRVSAVFHRSVEAYYRQLRELRPLLTQELSAQLQQQQRQQHNRSSSGISSDAEGEIESELSPLGEMPPRLQRHLVAREQLLVEVGRMVRLGRLLKKRLKEPFVLDALTGKSVVADELPLDSSPSPLHDSGRTSSAGSEVPGEAPPQTVQVVPTGSNELACAAISHKLGAIAEVAESLDAVIRDVQQQEKAASNGITNGTTSHGIKKLGSIEDWHSRSTEDESFATASEGNFTPNSHSSSFQTASGRTSSYIGSAKNSFDEADDSTLSTFEIPELPQSPVNMSFDSSELSYFSARQQRMKSEDQDSVVGVAELHSQSVTPTPDDEEQQHLLLPLPLPQAIESDSEVEGFNLATGITTETGPRISNAHTPEVSYRSGDTANTAPTSTNPNESKPPTSWRRSKYYENITKQTIKGFL